MVYITRGLLDALLEMGEDAEPESITVGLSVTQAKAFDAELSVPPSTPVFTHLYLPDAGRSVSAVFGVDLGTPIGQTQGLFVTHPQGDLEVSLADDLHEVVIVAIPPWDDGSIAAFGRDGGGRDLVVVDAAPPPEEIG